MNQPTATRIKSRILIPVSLTIIVLLIVFVITFNLNQQASVENKTKDDASRIQALFDGFLDTESKLMTSQIFFLAQEEELIDAFVAQDRDALLNAARPTFNFLRDIYRVTHFYFTDLDRVNFLRVHNPSNYGDTINRFTQLESERTGNSAYGIEMGASGLFTLRVVVPWRTRGEQIGYIELGMEIEHIINLIYDALGNELIFVIDKQYMDQSAWEDGMDKMGRDADWDQFSTYAVIDSTLSDIPTGITDEILNMVARDELVMFEVVSDVQTSKVNVVPLINAAGQQLGKILVLTDITTEKSDLQTSTITVVGIVAVIGVVLIVFFNFYVGRIETVQNSLVLDLRSSTEEVQKRVEQSEIQRKRLEESNEEIERQALAEQEHRKRLQELIEQVQELIEKLHRSSGEIQSVAMQQLASATEQDASVTQAATTVEEIMSTVRQTAERAQSVAEASQASIEVSQEGEKAVNNTIEGMRVIRERVEKIAETILALSSRTQQIGEIIETVNALADQSKLLSLNASIEAARAGEEGRGFAVVAMEVRQLAEQSRQATSRINEILHEIQQATNTAVMATEEGSKGADAGMKLVDQAGNTIQQLAGTLSEVSQAASQIAASTHQQSNGMEQLSLAMHQIKLASTESATSTRQVEHSIRSLSETARELNKVTSIYSVEDEEI